eukprot:m.220460 g.220460  ORF g.220460 m.220460 type:complete len:1111 (-) comp33315_c5_seq2:107-3439(-)
MQSNVILVLVLCSILVPLILFYNVSNGSGGAKENAAVPKSIVNRDVATALDIEDMKQTVKEQEADETTRDTATTPVTYNADAIPVWLWVDYKNGAPGYIELNIQSIERMAPPPRFKVMKVTPDMIRDLVPDLPVEYDRLPYAAATSDFIRTALIAHYGGFYMDTDFLVQDELSSVADLLNEYDFVSYTTGGQDPVRYGSFSSNFIAAKKGNALSVQAWQAIKNKLKQKCLHKDGTPAQGVCCYEEDGSPRKCHVPWAGIGERTSHPILKDLMKNHSLKVFCFGGDDSFVPHTNNDRTLTKEQRLDMYKLMWVVLDGKVCRRVNTDLVCTHGSLTASSPNFFGRKAYHMFASISASKEVKALTQQEILTGRWAASELYRKALGKSPIAAIDKLPQTPPPPPPSPPPPKQEPEVKSTSLRLANVVDLNERIPIWIWMDYNTATGVPPYIELNLRSMLHNAPADMFEIHLVTHDMLKVLIPDMPKEFAQIDYAAAVSDLIRTALLAHYGGLYMDTDFLVRESLVPLVEKLKESDVVSYVVTGQPCHKGIFSSNFLLGRKGNPLSVDSWAMIKQKLASRCNATTEKQGVCCYTPEGKPRKCNVPWAGIGERTSHPISRQLIIDQKYKLYCYAHLESFVPDTEKMRDAPKEAKLNMYLLSWINLDDGVCRKDGRDLRCVYASGHTSNSTDYFNRRAYHMFATISATKEVKALTADEIIKGNWAVSYLYRDALGIGTREDAQSYTLPPLPPQIDVNAKRNMHVPLDIIETNDNGATDTDTDTTDIDTSSTEHLSSYYAYPPKNDRAANLATEASFHLEAKQPCVAAFSDWQGKPLDPEDQWQCPRGNMSFVHIPKTAGTAVEGLAKQFGYVWGHDYDSRRWDLIKALEKTDTAALARLPEIPTNIDDIRVCTKGCPCSKGCCWWHVPPRFVADWRPYYRYPIKFCIVRNPFERVLSQYAWNGGQCPNTQELLEKRNERINRDLKQFKSRNYAMQDCHYLPQSWYVAGHIGKAWMEKVWENKDLSEVLTQQQSSPISMAEAQSCNFVLRHKHLKADLDVLSDFAGSDVRLPERKTEHKSYSQKCDTKMSRETIDLVLEIYKEDFDRFGYSHEWPSFD